MIDIRKLAEEVGVANVVNGVYFNGALFSWDSMLQAFADAVLEEAANTCDKIASDHCITTASMTGAYKCGHAIRALKAAK